MGGGGGGGGGGVRFFRYKKITFIYRPVYTQIQIRVRLIIIIMEICKAPALRLKALNKHIHIMYIEMENFIIKKEAEKRRKDQIVVCFSEKLSVNRSVSECEILKKKMKQE